MKTLKILGIVLLLFLVVGSLAYLYIFRQQEIRVDYIPKEFEFCGSTITEADVEYQELVKWLHDNKDGWSLSFVSYMPRDLYRHPAFFVNVMEDGITVSYKTDLGYPQFAKTIEHELTLRCVGSR